MERSTAPQFGFPRQHSNRGTRVAAAAFVATIHLLLILAVILNHRSGLHASPGMSEISVSLAPGRAAARAALAPPTFRAPELAHPVAAPEVPPAISTEPSPTTQATSGPPQVSDTFTIGGTPSANQTSDFRSVLLRHISDFRQYPAAGLGARLSGTSHVAFTLNRAGALLFVTIQQSSGSQILDDEAIATIRRSQPFPVVPDDLPDPLTVTVPVDFVAPR